MAIKYPALQEKYATANDYSSKVRTYCYVRYHTESGYREKSIANSARWARNNPEKMKAYQQAYRARKRAEARTANGQLSLF